jgi:hypothetical protein
LNSFFSIHFTHSLVLHDTHLFIDLYQKVILISLFACLTFCRLTGKIASGEATPEEVEKAKGMAKAAELADTVAKINGEVRT